MSEKPRNSAPALADLAELAQLGRMLNRSVRGQ